ncbi:sigma-E processing peptidase SpoIIGA [Anaerobacillus alkalilacustris]|uniref:Sporulation sigma-E factor-processing peptidase n=1 Tax=Anaerobacillus alkalilacustris TaxID=393763 RepID=A0A1S2LL51_9BACI|nr:sigma-E processing peptidase SpoIIGA [Anaerobacillus alkalilacustris]OIJ13249.1 sigma-E processing peptidase SpoIIGA [Anaerobacillus alkalilacustris]
MAIYLDVIWFLNFCIDLFLLLLTGLVLKRKLVKWRMITGAMVASSVIFLVLTPLSTLYYHPMFKMLFSIVIVVTSFGFKRFSYFIQNLLTFYFVSFICGGGLIALHYFFNNEMVILNGVVTTKSTGFGTPISWVLLIVGFPLIWIFSKKRLEQIEVRKIKYDEIVHVDLFINEHYLPIKGLIDSGNQLQDPITRKPVMIIDMSHLQDKFPKNMVHLAKNPEMIGDPNFPIGKEWEEKLSIIPYRGVGQVNQFIIGIKPNKVMITDESGEELDCSNAIVGLNFTNLSSEGDFQCILHPQMLIQGKKRLA